MLAAAIWNNVLDPANVDGDSHGLVTPIDALTVIEELIRPQFHDPRTGRLPKQIPDDIVAPPFIDVTCDSLVTPRDVLLVVERLVHGGGGGTHSGGGTYASVSCSPQLLEGSGFLSQLSQTLVLPDDTSAIEVSFLSPEFDTHSQGTMQDAFEIEITDTNGDPLSLPFAPGHDAVLNWSETTGPAHGLATTLTPGAPDEDWKVTVNLNGLPQGTEVQVRARLVNNDHDEGTSVIVRGFEVVDAPTQPPAGIQSFNELPASRSDLEFEELADLSSSFSPTFGRSSLNGEDDELASELTITNQSNFTVRGSLVVAVGSLSSPDTHAVGPDGLLPDGRPFFDLSAQLPNGQLRPGESVSSRRLAFLNNSDERFNYELSTYGKLNRAPRAFDSTPFAVIEAGSTYRYTAHASDDDDDSLEYSVSVGPVGAAIDSETGELRWPTTATDAGNHQFTLRATDPHGLFSEQTFSVDVVPLLQNRPPVFVSDPDTEAIAASGFEVSTVSTGSSPSDIALVDVGVDKGSLVTINPGSQTVSQISALPHDNYAPPTDLSVGEPVPNGNVLRSGYNIDVGLPPFEHPNEVNSIVGFDQGDINGDGIPDFVSNTFARREFPSRHFEQRIIVNYGDGEGGFDDREMWALPTSSTGYSDYSTLAVADFTNDGWDDVLTLHGRDSELLLLSGDGQGSLNAPQALPLTVNLITFKVFDINGDGALDLYGLAADNQQFGYLAGTGDGTFGDFIPVITLTGRDFFQTTLAPSRPYDAEDIDGDGDIDFAVVRNNNSNGADRAAMVMVNDGMMGFTQAAALPIRQPGGAESSRSFASTLEIADFTGDVHADVLIGTDAGKTFRTGGFILYSGDGNGTDFSYQDASLTATANPGNAAGSYEPIDIDHDGDLDMLVGSAISSHAGLSPTVLLNNGDGRFVARQLTSASSDPGNFFITDTEATARAVVAGDYNSDGVIDLAFTRSSTGGRGDFSVVTVVPADKPGRFASGFTTTFSQPANSSNSFFQSGDFNNDGYLDIWSPGFQSVSRTWFGDGSGTYSDDRSVIATPVIGGEGVGQGFTKDLDHDGNLDVVWLGRGGIQGGPESRLLVAMGNGDGTFTITFAETGAGTLGIARPADFNEDGFIDIATRSHGPQVDVWLYDPANRGTFIRSQTFPLKAVGVNVTGYFTALAVDDFDNDGHMDMATVDREQPTSGQHLLTTWYGNGDGTFDSAIEEADFFGNPDYTAPYFADSGDFNEDGLPDIVTYEFFGLSVHINRGDRSFELPVYYPGLRTNRSFNGLHVLDIDGDGHKDIVFTDSNAVDQINIMRGRGDGTFEPRQSFDRGYDGGYLTFDDFDNDSRLDILASTFTFAPIYTTILGARPGLTDLVTVDINDDGNDDVFATNADNSRIKFFLGDNLGRLHRQPDLFTDFGPVAIGTADFNGDLQTELFSVNHSGSSVSVFEGTTESGFSRTDVAVGVGPVDGTAKDVTGDTVADLLVIDDVRNALWTVPGNGDLTFAAPLPTPLGDRPGDLFVVDLDADSHADVLITLPDSKRLMIMRNDGSGTFAAPSHITLPGVPSDVAAADFNVDGNTDIAVPLADTNQLAIYFGRGSGQFAKPQLIMVGDSPSSVSLGDADDDGRVDLLVANAGDDTASVIFNRFDPTQVYRYRAQAIDPDDDPVTYSLLEGPGGLILNPTDGHVLWAPSADQVGQHRVTLQADDGRGGQATQSYVIDVQPARTNHDPLIASEPTTTIAADETFDYKLETRDADGNPLRYRLLDGPVGASLDSTSGALTWAGTTDGGIEMDPVFANKVVTPHSTSLELTDATLETWFKFDGVRSNGAQYLISKGSNTNISYALVHWVGQLRAEIGDGTTAGIVRAAIPFQPELDRWYHFAMTFDDTAGELRLFIDGEQVALTMTDKSIGNFDAPLQIGSPLGIFVPDGTFDNTRVWNVARTPQQIREGMSRQYDGDPTLVLDYRYNSWAAQSVIDYSAQRNDGVLNGATAWPIRAPGLAITNPAHFRVSVEDGRGGRDEQSFDVTFVPPLRGSVTGTVFVDADADGTLQSGEATLADWLIYADTNGNSFPDPSEPQAISDAAGQYTIDRLLPGDYSLRAAPRAGFATPPPKTISVSANHETLVDFAITELALGQIRGQVQTADEVAAARQQVFADLDRNGTLDAGEPTTETDSQGNYAITGLAAGDYQVRLAPRAGWNVTEPTSGVHDVTLEQDGIAAGNDFTLTANNTTSESGLTFVTTPNSSATGETLEAGSVYRYHALAKNWTGSAITYDLSLAPDGLSIDSRTGLVIWRPRLNQLGEHRVILRARDSDNGVALQDFSLRVVAANTAPVITSAPPNTAHVGIPVVYRLEAQDAESSALSYSLTSGPASASVHPDTGVLRWTPQVGDVGQVSFTVTVADQDGAEASQSFSIDVDNTSPSTTPFAMKPFRMTAAAGEDYRAHITATDALGRPIAVTLRSGPAGMQLGLDGILEWTPSSNDIGQVPFVLLADDGLGNQHQFSFELTVTQRLANSAPSITSDPVSFAVAGRDYSYDVVVDDADHDALSFELVTAPPGMSIDRMHGRIRWTPPTDLVGSHEVSVRVVDAYGAEDVQSHELRVRRTGGPPVITSTPPTEASAGTAWLYSVLARDAEMDPLSFSLLQAPTGMTIDPVTGEMSWTPDLSQTGLQAVAIQVADGTGGVATQSFAVNVSDGVPNMPPVITTTAQRFGAVGTEYRYQVHADDPEGTTITYSVSTNPTGMTIDSATGLVQWTPNAADVGKHVVTIVATDEGGAAAVQSFELDILAQNRPPQFASVPPSHTFAGELLRYTAVAQDADLDPLLYELVQGPDGMSIDPFGTVTWQTSTSDIGSHPVTLRAEDPRGGVDEQSFVLQVSEDTVPPRVVVNTTGFRLPWNGPLSFFVSAIDNVGVERLEVTVNDKPFPLQADGMGYLTFDEWGLGVHNVVATATDAAGNVAQATGAVGFCDPCGGVGSTGSGGINNPLADITSPVDAATVTGMVSITGTANIDGFDHYRLLYRRADQDQFTEFLQSTAAVTDGELGVWDTSLLENDEYVLRLEVVDVSGRVAVDDVRVGLSRALKLGNFRLSFTDLTIPVSGIPIQVVRTYDTLRADREGDFGFGWRLEFRDADLRVGLPKSGLEDIGIYTPMRPGVKVYMTLPGQERMGWTFTPRIRVLPGLGDNLVLASPRFTPDPGNTAQLQVGGGQLFVNERGELFAAGNIPWNPAAPDFGGGFTVVTRDGLRYRIDGDSGKLNTVTDRNGNTLTFSDAGIESDSGIGIDISRDGRGRITAITDPLGNSVRYGYSSAGDLVSVTDREGNETTFVYDAARAHYLQEVIDPLGRTGARTEYDADGRLVRTFDAGGTPVQFSFDQDASAVTVTDQLGNSSVNIYDNQGNIVRTIDALGGQTVSEYDDAGHITRRVDAVGRVTTFEYDTRGNLVRQIDAAGGVRHFTYDSKSHLISVTDPTGATYRSEYDDHGNRISVTDPLGGTTRVTVDGQGRIIFDTDPLGRTLGYTYDASGLTSVVRPNGETTSYVNNAIGLTVSESTNIKGQLGTVEHHVSYGYDRNGRLTSMQTPLNATSSLALRSDGLVSSVTQPDGTVTSVSYDARGFPSGLESPLSPTIQTTRDPLGRPLAFDLGGKLHAQRDYDALGRVTKETLDGQLQATYDYDAVGQLKQLVRQSGTVEEFEYDTQGNITEHAISSGPTVQFRYDANDRLTRTQVGSSIETYAYDAVGQLTSINYSNGSQTTFRYDSAGNLIQRVSRTGAEWHFQYDSLGNLVQVTGPLGGITRYGTDSVGGYDLVTDPLGRTTRIALDEGNRRTWKQLPLGQEETYSYASSGAPLTHTTFAGDTYHFTYDAQRRLTQVEDDHGNIIEQRSYTPSATTVVTRYGTSTREVLSDGGIRATSVNGQSVIHRNFPNEVAQVTTSNRTTQFHLPDGKLESVIDHVGDTTTRTYDAFGLPQSTRFPDGSITHTSFNLEGGLLQTRLSSGGETLLAELSFQRDNANRVVSRTIGERSDSYVYDMLGRLIKESTTSSGTSRVTHYEYDAANNLTTVVTPEGRRTLQYDANDRLVSNGGRTYSFDDNGNLRSSSDGAASIQYDYDEQQRLRRVEVVEAGVTHVVEYAYDSNGLPAKRIVDGSETRYIWDDTTFSRPFLMEVQDADGRLLRKYEYDETRYLRMRDADGKNWILITDQVGTVVGRSDGAVVDYFDFDAFGNLASTSPVDIGFAGGLRDPITGLTFFASRWYDPSSARFISPDSDPGKLTDPQTVNRYTYSQADPVNKVDPSGQTTVLEVLNTVSLYSGLAAGVAGLAISTSPQSILNNISGGRLSFTNKTAESRPFFEADVGLFGMVSLNRGTASTARRSAPVQISRSAGVSAIVGLEALTIGNEQPGSTSQLFLYVGGGLGAGVSGTLGAADPAASAVIRTLKADVFDTKTNADYAGLFVGISGGFMFKLTFPNPISPTGRGGRSFGRVSSVAFSPSLNPSGLYSHSAAVIGGATTLVNQQGWSLTFTLSGGFSFTFYGAIGEPFQTFWALIPALIGQR